MPEEEVRRQLLEDLVHELKVTDADRQKFDRAFNESWDRNVQPQLDRFRERIQEFEVSSRRWQPLE